MSGLVIVVLVLSTHAALGGLVNTWSRDGNKWLGLAWFVLCMAGLIAARWML